MYMVLFVLDDPEHLDAVLSAWSAKGLTGVTIIESTGLHRRQKRKRIPMRYTYGDYVEEEGHYTLLAIVDSQETVQTCLEEAERTVGDLCNPNTGVFAAWPLSLVKGVCKTPPQEND